MQLLNSSLAKHKLLKVFFILLGSYIVLVLGFASFVVYQGQSHAERGVSVDEDWVELVTKADAGNEQTSILAGVEVDGKLYVAANHWPRSWYLRATKNPQVFVTSQGVRAGYQAVPLDDTEHDYIVGGYSMPLVFRILTGFPPRRFLRLDRRDI